MKAVFKRYILDLMPPRGSGEAEEKAAFKLRDEFLAKAKKVGGGGIRILNVAPRSPMVLFECTDFAKHKLERAGLFSFENDGPVKPASHTPRPKLK